MFNRISGLGENKMVLYFEGDLMVSQFHKLKKFDNQIHLFPSVNESDIGMILIDFLSTDFSSRQSFDNFINNWGISGLVDFSDALKKSLNTEFYKPDEIEEILNEIQNEISPIMTNAQKYFTSITNYCLKKSDEWKDYSIHQRYYLVWSSEKLVNEINKSFPIIDKCRDRVETIFTMRFKEPQKLRDIMEEFEYTIKSSQFTPGEVYQSNNLIGLLCIVFEEMIKRKICVNVCGNCGLFFLPKNRIDTKYCTRVQITKKGSRSTCQQIGATREYSKKTNDSTLYKEYRKKYKTNYARFKAGAWDKHRWELWSAKAKTEFNKYRSEASEENQNIFFKWLDDSSTNEWYKKQMEAKKK